MEIKVASPPQLYVHVDPYILFEWFEVTSIKLFLFAFVYSSLLAAYLIKKVFVNCNMYEIVFHVVGYESHG